MTAQPFAERERVDAHDKVLGRTQFAADLQFPDMLYAMLVPATIAKGQVLALDTDAATRVPGVVRVLTAGDFSPPPPFRKDGPPPPPPTIENDIRYLGQPVALVLGETLEAAVEGGGDQAAVRYARLHPADRQRGCEAGARQAHEGRRRGIRVGPGRLRCR